MDSDGPSRPPVPERPTTSRAAAGSAVVAIVGLLALLDAAVETIWFGSSLRWRVAPPTLLFVALSVWWWRPGGWLARRWGWPGAAQWSVSGLLLLLAATAWLPGGQADGVRMGLQPSSTLLAAASALGVALAGMALCRARMLPWWSRVALGALAAYGVVSFAVAVGRATPYAALLHGASAWTRLPFWLQGAFVGGMVVLPAALVLVVVQQGFRLLRRAGPGGWTLQQAVALTLILVMTLSGLVAPGGAPAPTPVQPAAAGTASGPPPLAPGGPPIAVALASPPPPVPAPTIEQLEADFTALARRLPEAEFNADAQARSLGPSVEAIFAFVRDRIRYEAYSGILRGANGTLAARAGNSFDRSLLLARMLGVHGVRTRFVRGELARAEAEVLFGRIFDGFRPPPTFAASTDRAATEVSQFWERVTARARRDYTVIRSTLGNRLPAPERSPRAQALIDIQQHVWVQADVGGKWLDLDTSFAAAASGTARCAVKQTVNQVPGGWHQRVTVRVSEERLTGGGLRTTPALEVTLPAADLVDQEVFLVHVAATGGGGGLGLGAAGGPQGADRWAPALSIAEDVRVGRAVAFVDTAESTGFFDALGGGGSSELVAEWLEFEVARPDGRRDVTRRTIVDRATAAWRASKDHAVKALRPLARDEKGLVAPRAIRNIWFSAGPHNLRGYADTVFELSAAGEPGPEASLDIQLLPLALSNFSTLVWADHAAIPAVNDLPQVRLYSDSPRIVIVSVVPDAKGGMVEELDLRRDWLCGVARDASADGLAVDRKIWFAALEGALEHEAVARDKASVREDASEVASTSSLLTAEGAVALGSADLERLPQLVPEPEKAARMDAVIRAGHVLVVPRAGLAAGPAGWWEIAPGGDARAVLGSDLNLSAAGFNSWGGSRAMASRIGIHVIRDPVSPKTWSSRFGNRDPRPPKEKKSHGLEYGMVLALVAIATICAQKYYNSQLELRAYELRLAMEAGDKWEKYYRGEPPQ